MSHYCDDIGNRNLHFEDGKITFIDWMRDSEKYTPKPTNRVPLFVLPGECCVCGREYEMIFAKLGTWDSVTGEQIYGP